jgi:superfamily II DNA/RNA helicase
VKHNFDAGALHGDLAQSVRFSTLEKFKAGEIRLLVCSDVAARGIDIGGLSHVFNFDVPHHAEDYVHRIGRTGRAGKDGRAFTIAAPEDRLAVEAIEKLVQAPIPRIEIPGLDVVEWAEDDGRRGRGRGRGKPSFKPSVRPERVPVRAAEDVPAERAPRPERAARPERAPRPERSRDRTRAEPRAEEAAIPEAPREAYVRRDRDRDRPPRDRGERNDRGDRYGDRDNGPSVLGFGSDVPAFMLIRKRGPVKDVEIEETDEDVGTETSSDTDIAA